MCVCVCACVRARARARACACVRVRARACVRACVTPSSPPLFAELSVMQVMLSFFATGVDIKGKVSLF